MANILLLLVLSAICAASHAKHIHPKTLEVELEEEIAVDSDPIPTDIDGIPIEVIQDIKPSRFVPINNLLFFTRYPPCEEGFKRDLLGVCREVW